MADVLLFVSGTTPQIVTETLWGLHHRHHPEFSPTHIHVITTAQGRRVLDQRLKVGGKLAELCGELGITPVPRIIFHLIRDASGKALDDIRNTEENTLLANTIMTVVRDLTARLDCRLHASLSGGRKTMSFYMGYAMSLYGRPQDALYHVMVPPIFERCPDFYFIPRVHRALRTSEGVQVSTSEASIEVASIPFLRLREWINEPLLNSPTVSFTALTESVQVALKRPHLSFNSDECTVTLGIHTFELRPQLFAMYRVLADAAAKRLKGAGPDGIGAGHDGWLTSHDFATSNARGTKLFLTTLDGLTKTRDERYSYIKALIEREGKDTKAGRLRMSKFFNPILSRLREALKTNVVDPALRREFWIESRGRNPARYGLLANRDQIHL